MKLYHVLMHPFWFGIMHILRLVFVNSIFKDRWSINHIQFYTIGCFKDITKQDCIDIM